eukprot:3235659-Rhodomonas_salina.1
MSEAQGRKRARTSAKLKMPSPLTSTTLRKLADTLRPTADATAGTLTRPVMSTMAREKSTCAHNPGCMA